MIRHIVFFSAKAPENLPRMEEGLSRLGRIPGTRNFSVSRNTRKDRLSGEIDLVVYAEFDDYEALEAYKQHPLYQESVSIVRPLRELRFVADCEM